MAGVVAGGSLYGSILQFPVAWCKMYLVTESKTHRITRHLRFEKATEAGVLARDEGVFFMSSTVFELKVSARKFCKRNRIDINEHRLMRIIRKVVKRAEHEQQIGRAHV